MKVELFLYGMQTADGKILKLKSPGTDSLLTLKSQEILRRLTPSDSHKYLWFPTENTIAYPVVVDVADKDPKHGGRTWVQNQTFLVGIHEFIGAVQEGRNPFELFRSLVVPEMDVFPDPLAVNV